MFRNRYRKRFSRPVVQNLDVPEKANRVLNVILIALLLIVVRVWHLSVIQYEDRFEMARRPQRKVVVEAAKRATIRDRFNLPLAVNKIQYDAAIVYSELQQIPSFRMVYGPDGKKKKVFKRKEYIEDLAKILGQELKLDPIWIEDVIYSKAAFQFHVPFVLKKELSESEYYRLKGLENSWLGIHVMCVPRRYYPQGKVAGDLIGYMGAISREKYEAILAKIGDLKEFIQAEESGETPAILDGYASSQAIRQHLLELEEQAYTINDWVGKSGIEEKFETDLRGYHGKKFYHSDARGNFLKELPGSTEPLSGQRLLLTISSELQNYAEQLLAQNEQIRKVRVTKEETINLATREPWIKGGAIVAMEPSTGEVLALASYPRFDPNDFISSSDKEISQKKRDNIMRWLESETYIADIWNQKRPIERELYNKKKEEFYEENEMLDWDHYLTTILPPQNPVRIALQKIYNLEQTTTFLNEINQLLAICQNHHLAAILNIMYREEGHIPDGKALPPTEKEALLAKIRENQSEVAEAKLRLNQYIGEMNTTYEKVLFIDLCRLIVDESTFDSELLPVVGEQTLVYYRNTTAASLHLRDVAYSLSKELFHQIDFSTWRKENQQAFLKQKRQEEKLLKQYAKPYITLLEKQEAILFKEFWDTYKWDFLTTFLTGKCGAVDQRAEPYIEYFNQLRQKFEHGELANEKWVGSYAKVQEAIKNIPSSLIEDYLKTMRGYHDLNRQLFGSYRYLRKSSSDGHLEKDLAAGFYPKYGFGYGRSQGYRQATTQGSIFKLITAYEALKQKCEALEGHSYTYQDLNPLTLNDCLFRKGKEVFLGYTQDGKAIPQLYKGGRIPKSLTSRIGKVDLKRAIETSSNPYFSLLAGDILQNPEDLARAAREFSYGATTGIDLPNEIAGNVPKDLAQNRTGLYATAIGQHTLVVTPLQTATMLSALANGGKVLQPKIIRMRAGKKLDLGAGSQSCVEWFPPVVKKEVFLPVAVRKVLMEGLQQVSMHLHRNSLPALAKVYQNNPEAIKDFVELKEQLVGKSSTAEALENLDLALNVSKNICNHVWFGGISFSPKNTLPNESRFIYRDPFGNPELVVVVYLKYGSLGKEAAPIAAQIVKKWREIKERHGKQLLLHSPTT